jgi:enoyl-[acyl-carrier-protein] reductase (NADH)
VKHSDLLKTKCGPLCRLSDLSASVTGRVYRVDLGHHVVGMKRPDAPDISRSKD